LKCAIDELRRRRRRKRLRRERERERVICVVKSTTN
jgi:hypothetical protein